MKTRMAIMILYIFQFISCDGEKNDKMYPIGAGFEIYDTVNPYSYNLESDYSIVNFDTVQLKQIPILKYEDLIKYDTSAHKLTIDVSHNSLKIDNAGVNGRMFVVTLDNQPVYCGFKWPVISSVPCHWIYIEEPYEELDGLLDSEIVISFSTENYPDPRLDKRIIDRLTADGKIE
ncbi:MAG: hypothetical protein KFF73_13915 [Cyclobacteriaceae bacterium]|nr:hypothetical protein [Cyclobacteriaceae bacterium]